MSATALHDAFSQDASTTETAELCCLEPAEFVQKLTSHSAVQRVSDLPPHLVGVRDCLTGAVYVVTLADLTRYRSTMLHPAPLPEWR